MQLHKRQMKNVSKRRVVMNISFLRLKSLLSHSSTVHVHTILRSQDIKLCKTL